MLNVGKVEALQKQHAAILGRVEQLERFAFNTYRNSPSVMVERDAGATDADLLQKTKDWLERNCPLYVDWLASLSIITFQMEALHE